MSYTNDRTFAWVDDQPEPDNIEVMERIQRNLENMTPTQSEDYWDFEQLMVAFENKRNLPLIDDLDQDEKARDHEKKLGHQRRAMRPTKVTHMLHSRRVNARDQSALLNSKTLLHVARTNFLSTAVIRSIILSNVAINTPEYNRQYDIIQTIQEDCYESSFRYIDSAVTKIVTEVDRLCGPSFFAEPNREERYGVWSTIFRQFPSKYVNFREIFGGAIRRRDLVQKKKWKAFYEYGFVLFCDKVFLWQQNGGGDALEAVVKEAWLRMDRRERVRVLGVGGVFDLPEELPLRRDK